MIKYIVEVLMKNNIWLRSCIVAALAAPAVPLLRPQPPAAKVQEIVVVYKTHFDIGYTDLARNIVQKYRTTMIDQALDVVERNRTLPADQQFVWTVAAWPMKKILQPWTGQTPERQQKVLAAFKSGRFALHALPFTVQTEMYEPETLVRGLGIASRLAREAGLELPRAAKMTDVPSHSWLLPTLLRHAGVDFLHLGCNPASSSPRVPPLFWWEGPDGSRLLTMYSAAGYGTGLEPPANWPYKTWLAFVMTGDNQGPPKPEEVKALLDEAARKYPGVKVRIGTLSDFSDRILAEKPTLPVVRGDMPDTWIHGPMSDPAGVITARETEPALAAAESLGTLLAAWGVKVPDSAQTVADAYEQSLLYFEHTWGGALSWVTRYGSPKGTGTADNWGYGAKWRADMETGRFKRLQESWQEHSAYSQAAHNLVTPLLADNLRALASAVGVKGRRIVVYNPLPWTRDGMVAVNVGAVGMAAVRPAAGGEATPAAMEGPTVRFLARDVPPLGYRVYVPVRAATPAAGLNADEGAALIENQFLRITLDPARGTIASMVDKRSGRELVDRNASQGFGQYLYERFDATQIEAFIKDYVKLNSDWGFAELGKPNLPPASAAPRRMLSPTKWTLSAERSPAAVAAVLRYRPEPPEPKPGRTAASGRDTSTLAYAVTMKVTLPAAAPYAEIELTLDKPADPWPEAGWISLPFNVEQPRFRVGRGGSIIDPAADIVSGSNRYLFAVESGVAVMDPQGRGAAVSGLDTPLVSLGAPGLWKFGWDDFAKKPAVYFNLFNNQWTTNYRFWNSGKFTYRFRVWSFDAWQPEPALITPALEARQPLRAAVSDGPAGPLDSTQAGIGLSRRGIAVTAFGPNPDGQGTLLRVWEQAGASGEVKLTLPATSPFTKAVPVNLRGQPAGEPLVLNSGEFRFSLPAYTPSSFLLSQ